MPTKISVIIPTYNESELVIACISRLKKYGQHIEIIVVDAPTSEEGLRKTLQELPCRYVVAAKPGRNYQMNEGAKKSFHKILYFVHADTLVHHSYEKDIFNALANGFDLGSYSYKFDRYPHPFMHINAAFTKLPMLWCRGGDQTLFITKDAFMRLGGFCEKHVIMEDYDLLKRAKEEGLKFKLFKKDIIVSCRKYEKNSYFQIQRANFNIMRKWLNGSASPTELLNYYHKALNK